MTAGERRTSREKVEASLGRRYRRERVFRLLGLGATAAGIAFLALFLFSLVRQAAPAFVQSYVRLDVSFDPGPLTSDGELDLVYGDFDALVRSALENLFPEVSGRNERRELNRILSIGAGFVVRDLLAQDPSLLGQTRPVWVPASADVDSYVKGGEYQPVSELQAALLRELEREGRLKLRFNEALFTNGDSREPELAGIRGAMVGSLYMLLVTVVLAFPLGVAAAIYLEEFAPKGRWADLVEVNINNLAAVPSIVFGLLGLAVFINWMGMPRSAPLVGGLVLSLLTLPVIIIASRAAIQAVPPSLRDAALGLGASRMQVVFHHVLPLALPGMLTGTIIGMSRALGETAPLLMIGMVAFIVDVPSGLTDPSTALPVQIYLWADSPERAFFERTSAAIIVLLGFLLLMNLAAVIVRRKTERRW
jgi:phosphate transport system permease protein